MSTKSTKAKPLSEEAIDELTIAQADDDSAWEAPIEVKGKKSASFSLPSDLAARAAFLSRVHRAKGVEVWLSRIIRERIELEEVAFAAAKREITARSEK
ncbi:MAG TPA: hypothetical protein VJ885_19790 [Thermoanaerobaculia bacterium]|jgi:hypothetical protein|nr:hypothetical protein [Thermoanaerobaculia bacterium]